MRRRFDELLKSFSEELEGKMLGSQPGNIFQSSRSFLKSFKANTQEMDEEAQLASSSMIIT